MAVLTTTPEMMAESFLAGLSFLPALTNQNARDSMSTKNKKRKNGGKTVTSRGKASDVATTTSAPQWCEVCKITLNAPNQLEQHYAGKSHSKRLKMTQREAEELVKKAADSQIPEDEPPVVAPSRLVKRLIDANAPRGENGKLRCVLCHVTMPSPQVAQTHFSGKKHQKKLEALKMVEETTEEIFHDTPCDITQPGAVGTDVTLSRAVKKQSQRCQSDDSSDFPSSPSVSSSSPTFIPTVAAFKCEVCTITVTSMTQLTQHQSGLKHLRRVQKLSQQ